MDEMKWANAKGQFKVLPAQQRHVHTLFDKGRGTPTTMTCNGASCPLCRIAVRHGAWYKRLWTWIVSLFK